MPVTIAPRPCRGTTTSSNNRRYSSCQRSQSRQPHQALYNPPHDDAQLRVHTQGRDAQHAHGDVQGPHDRECSAGVTVSDRVVVKAIDPSQETHHTTHASVADAPSTPAMAQLSTRTHGGAKGWTLSETPGHPWTIKPQEGTGLVSCVQAVQAF